MLVSYAWDDIEVFWEIKSSDEVNNREGFANLGYQATKALRFQFQRRFVWYFLLCRTQLKIIQCDQSGMLVSLSANLSDNQTFIKCVLATLTLPDLDLGLPKAPLRTTNDIDQREASP